MCGARRRLWVLGTIALLFCGTRAWAGRAASVTLAINPATTMTNLGANFDVAIEVQAGAQQVDGASAYIDFDQSILQVVSITRREFSTRPASECLQQRGGNVGLLGGEIVAPFPTGTFTLATVTFTSIAASAGTPLAFHTAIPVRAT